MPPAETGWSASLEGCPPSQCLLLAQHWSLVARALWVDSTADQTQTRPENSSCSGSRTFSSLNLLLWFHVGAGRRAGLGFHTHTEKRDEREDLESELILKTTSNARQTSRATWSLGESGQGSLSKGFINELWTPPPRSKNLPRNCETQRPASIGWVALSSVVVVWSVVPHRWHLLSSPLYDVSEHTNHIFSVRIWSWQHVSVNISSVAELSPVYCCLFQCHFCLYFVYNPCQNGRTQACWTH